MPAAPTSLTVRAYDVGFGDCFLLSFQYPSSAKHILIDFGSMALPAGKTGSGPYMKRIANQIKADCGGKLTAVIATHRHKDHISGFSGDGETSSGGIIKSLQPEIVLEPWTEDPDAAQDARKAGAPRSGPRFRRNAMLLNLENMNRVAGFIEQSAGRLRGSHLSRIRRHQVAHAGPQHVRPAVQPPVELRPPVLARGRDVPRAPADERRQRRGAASPVRAL